MGQMRVDTSSLILKVEQVAATSGLSRRDLTRNAVGATTYAELG